MKTYTFILALIMMVLSSACSSSTEDMVMSTSTAAIETVTATPTQTNTPTPNATPTATPFPGAFNLIKQFEGIDDRFGYPGPDSTIAAGSNVLFVATNRYVKILDKNGNVLDSKTMRIFISSLQAGARSDEGDPIALYDPISKRFFFASPYAVNDPACVPPNCTAKILLAVSKTDNPATLGPKDWYFYVLDRTAQKTNAGIKYTSHFGDFDRLAIIGDVLAISWDVDSYGGYLGPAGQVRFIDKSHLTKGEAIDDWRDVAGLHGYVAKTFGDPGKFFLVQSTPSDFKIWSIENPLTSPAIIMRSVHKSESFVRSPDAAQPGGKDIDVTQGKTQSIYRDGSLWVAAVVGKDFGSGLVAAIYWAQIDVSKWPETNVVQSGIIGADGVWNYAPEIMLDDSNNFAIAYARSSASEFVSIYYSGRLAGDPLNTLRPAGMLKSGNVSFSPNQSGRNQYIDYLGIALDPANGSVWMMGPFPLVPKSDHPSSATWVGNIDWSLSASP
ncbi:MAG: hypothetical protein K8S20_14215 [Chloroflexi bacterium]|nr:hypothetical protein [Chloroflexota bacterium]